MGQVSTFYRFVFLLWNIVYFAVGAVMFGFGVFVIVDLNQYGFFTENFYVAGAGIFIFVGILKMVFSVVGVVGMFGKWRAVLGVYVAVVVALMLLTFTAAVYGFLRRVDAFDISRDRLERAYLDCADYRDDIETVQDELNCCGVNAASDSTRGMDLALANCTEPFSLTCSSTRNTEAPSQYRLGCLVYLTQEIQENLYNIGAIGMGFGTYELGSLLIAMQNLEGL